MYLTLMSDLSYNSQYIDHTIQFFGKTVTVIHELNSKQYAECTLDEDFIVTLDKEGIEFNYIFHSYLYTFIDKIKSI